MSSLLSSSLRWGRGVTGNWVFVVFGGVPSIFASDGRDYIIHNGRHRNCTQIRPPPSVHIRVSTDKIVQTHAMSIELIVSMPTKCFLENRFTVTL